MEFPSILGELMRGGFEGYLVDYRTDTTTYYPKDGETIVLAHPAMGEASDIAESFDAAGLQLAIREAQNQVPGYTYRGFCMKAKASGCAGYLVSLSGRRVLYFGRTAETHTELFPGQA